MYGKVSLLLLQITASGPALTMVMPMMAPTAQWQHSMPVSGNQASKHASPVACMGRRAWRDQAARHQASKAAAARHASAPMECVVDTGSSQNVAIRSQMPVAIIAHSMPGGGSKAGMRSSCGMLQCRGSVRQNARTHAVGLSRFSAKQTRRGKQGRRRLLHERGHWSRRRIAASAPCKSPTALRTVGKYVGAVVVVVQVCDALADCAHHAGAWRKGAGAGGRGGGVGQGGAAGEPAGWASGQDLAHAGCPAACSLIVLYAALRSLASLTHEHRAAKFANRCHH